LRLSRDSTVLNVLYGMFDQWHTQGFFSGGGGSTNSVEDREDGDLGAVAP